MSSPTSPKTDVRRTLSAILLLLIAAGCGTDVQDFSRAYFSEPVSLTKQDRPEFQLAPEAPAWEPPEHDNKNGTFSQMLWFEPEQATHIMALLKDHPAITALTQKTVEPGMTRDLLGNGTGPATITNEGLLLTGTREALDAAIALVEFVGTSIPQFEVEARIVEVRETDEFGFGIDSYILNRNQYYYWGQKVYIEELQNSPKYEVIMQSSDADVFCLTNWGALVPIEEDDEVIPYPKMIELPSDMRME